MIAASLPINLFLQYPIKQGKINKTFFHIPLITFFSFWSSYHHFYGTDRGTRTHTLMILSHSPLPIGLYRHIKTVYGGRYGNRTHLIFSVQTRWPPHAVPSPILAISRGIEPRSTERQSVIIAIIPRDHLLLFNAPLMSIPTSTCLMRISFTAVQVPGAELYSIFGERYYEGSGYIGLHYAAY